MPTIKQQQKIILKKLYRIQDDLIEIREYFNETHANARILKQVERMQYRVNCFIEKVKFD